MPDLRAGVAMRDITPPPGLIMSGFGARTAPAEGTHDPLTVRAVAVDDTAIVCADLIGFRADSAERIRAGCRLPADRVIVAASHTHGGPVSMPGRLGAPLDRDWLARVERQAIAAIDDAVAAQRPARLSFGTGTDPGVVKNRRHPGGLVDGTPRLLRLDDLSGRAIAFVASYACHPVVLGPLNLRYTADYQGYLRTALEATAPGSVALFLTGCTGDSNTGHSSLASMNGLPDPARSFEVAEAHGRRIAAAMLAAPLHPLAGLVSAKVGTVPLPLEWREDGTPEQLAQRWRAEQAGANPFWRATLQSWIDWAETVAATDLRPHPARVTVLNWAGLRIVALPGEIFSATGIAIRAALDGPAITVSYAEDNPGYICPRDEFAHGGYEPAEAHRYYGMPAAFAPGAAELLAQNAIGLARRVG